MLPLYKAESAELRFEAHPSIWKFIYIIYISLIDNFGRDKLLKELAHAGLAKNGFLA